MTLEKDKIYKIRHFTQMLHLEYSRQYIICSPKDDVVIESDYKTFETHFTICFSGRILTHGLSNANEDVFSKPSSTSISKSDIIEKLNNNDYNEIRIALGMLDNNYRYNRRLNKLIKA